MGQNQLSIRGGYRKFRLSSLQSVAEKEVS